MTGSDHIARAMKGSVWIGYAWPVLFSFFAILLLLGFLPKLISPFDYGEILLADSYLPPGSSSIDKLGRHWLGADALGRDVLAGIIGGARVSLLTGVFSVIIAASVGFVLGALAAHFGDSKQISLRYIVIVALSVISLGYLWAHHNWFLPGSMIRLVLLLLILILALVYLPWAVLDRRISMPLDALLLSWCEIFRAIPALLILLVMIPILKIQSSYGLIPLIAFFMWPSFALLMRSEVLRTREKLYVKIAQTQGIGWRRLLRVYYFKAVRSRLFVAMSFGVAAAIVLESSLSFLGLIATSSRMSWGGMLESSRSNLEAWWLAFFPGMAIFLVLIALHSFGRWWQDKSAIRTTWL